LREPETILGKPINKREDGFHNGIRVILIDEIDTDFVKFLADQIKG
jgi:hypothetical protein